MSILSWTAEREEEEEEEEEKERGYLIESKFPEINFLPGRCLVDLVRTRGCHR